MPFPSAAARLAEHRSSTSTDRYLTDPAAHGADAADAFHVVIPTQPGFGFSGHTTTLGWNAGRLRRRTRRTMNRLGYERYGVHGNDSGAIISPGPGQIDRDRAVAAHVNQIFSFPRGEAGEFDDLSAEDLQYISSFRVSWTLRSTTTRRCGSPRPWRTRCRTLPPASWPGMDNCWAT